MQEYVTGQEQLAPRLMAVKPLPDYQLELTFKNGERRHFDARPLLAVPAYAKLKNEAFFASVTVAYGSVQWPGEIDYCPDCLYQNSIPIQ